MSVRARRALPVGGWRALATLCAVLFLTFLDNTVVSVSLADIQTTLHSGVSQLQWIVDGYMLAFAGLMLAGGTLGDLLGRRRVMLSGVVLFCAGSLVAALAPGNAVLIGGRVLMGIGAAASEPGTLSMIRHVYPEPAQRARALGAWTAVSGAALALGPVLGGLLVGGVGWRGVFWFNLAFGALAFAAAAALLPESADPQGRRLDLLGLVLGVVGVTAATVAVIEGESAGYTSWRIDLLFTAALAAAVAFLVVERRSPDPVLKLAFFRERTFSVATIAAFATSFGIFAVFFFTALYLQLIGSFSGWRIALQFLAMAVVIIVAALAAGRWAARRGPRQPLTLGCLLAGAGLFAVDALLQPHVSLGALAGVLALAGLGFGLALVAATAAVLAIVPAERSGMAASTLNTSRMLGGVFGVAVLGALVNARLTASLTHTLQQLGIPANFQAIVIDAVTHGGLPTSTAGVHNPAAGHRALVAQVIHAAEDAFGSGLHLSLLVAGSILLATAAISLLAGRERPLRTTAARSNERLAARRRLSQASPCAAALESGRLSPIGSGEGVSLRRSQRKGDPMFRTIVWATDGSEAADRALPYAKALAGGGDRRLVVVHVKEILGGRAGGYPVSADEDELEAKIRHQVDELRREGFAVTLKLGTAMARRAAHVIAEAARDVEGDVIVVGTRRRSAISRLLLGSVTQRLLRVASCPVLAVPAGTEAVAAEEPELELAQAA